MQKKHIKRMDAKKNNFLLFIKLIEIMRFIIHHNLYLWKKNNNCEPQLEGLLTTFKLPMSRQMRAIVETRK